MHCYEREQTPAERAAQLGVTELQLKDVDAMWELSKNTFYTTKNSIIMPESAARALSYNGCEILKDRLSKHFGGASVTLSFDSSIGVCRIVPELKTVLFEPEKPSVWTNPELFSPSSMSNGTDKGLSAPKKSKLPAKKKSPPRPPNSFILYRQERHPILKSQFPDMHNNNISIILGRKWKLEPESVKAKYKALAEDYKRKHAAKHPGYQYAPRKPYEKKRRVTAAKLQRLAQAEYPKADLDSGAWAKSDGGDTDCQDAFDFGDLDPERRRSRPKYPRAIGGTQIIGGARPIGFPRIATQYFDQYQIMDMPQTEDDIQDIVDAQYANGTTTMPLDPTHGGNNSLTIEAGFHSDMDQAFFDTLVDWQAIAEDQELLREMSEQEMAHIAQVEVGGDSTTLTEEMERARFEEELARALDLSMN